MNFAYADPPYIGQARGMYACDEIDHGTLIHHLEACFDGYALSASTTSLRIILPLCRPEARVAAWVKPFAFFKGKCRPPYTWEPVVFYTPRIKEHRPHGTRDWLMLNAWGVTKKERDLHGIKGAKRPEFSEWMFALLGLTPDDIFVDCFPGSGMVTNAWKCWKDKLSKPSTLPER